MKKPYKLGKLAKQTKLPAAPSMGALMPAINPLQEIMAESKKMAPVKKDSKKMKAMKKAYSGNSGHHSGWF